MTVESRSQADLSLRARWLLGILSVSGLLLIFLFQRFDWTRVIGLTDLTNIERFVANRSIRFVINDVLGVLLVLSLFGKKNLAIIAVYIQILGFVFVMIPYIILKLNYPSYNGPMINFLHRLILNPLLIYLLVFFFWNQKINKQNTTL
jgi:exosortase F-associated protein